MSSEDGLDSDTVNSRSSPSVALASETVTTGAVSSSRIVPVPVSEVLPIGDEEPVTPSVIVSSGSSIVSSIVGTVMVAVVSPASKVTVTEVAV